MFTKIYSSIQKPKISTIEENHRRIIHLGSKEDDQNGEESPEISSHYSDSEDERPPKLTLLKSECSLSEDKLKGFKILGKLGEGTFAKVTIARDEDNNIFALKKMDKDYLEEVKVSEFILNEHNILQDIENPFILKMKHSFESESEIIFITEFMEGKDLKYQLEKNKRGLTLNEVKMIGAQLILSLECLHKNGYLHRDIKLENIMINKEGYVKLADFGLSNILSSHKRVGVSGSIEYMAPEVIQQNEYCNNQSVDWWAFGILLYDLHYQETPFCSLETMATFGEDVYEKTKEFIKKQELQFPSDPQPGRDREYSSFKSLLNQLLVKGIFITLIF